tara:strand:+ start:181 stop:378 length:198 start_codon:yes stop_codon:yes gene_type:complete
MVRFCTAQAVTFSWRARCRRKAIAQPTRLAAIASCATDATLAAQSAAEPASAATLASSSTADAHF